MTNTLVLPVLALLCVAGAMALRSRREPAYPTPTTTSTTEGGPTAHSTTARMAGAMLEARARRQVDHSGSDKGVKRAASPTTSSSTSTTTTSSEATPRVKRDEEGDAEAGDADDEDIVERRGAGFPIDAGEFEKRNHADAHNSTVGPATLSTRAKRDASAEHSSHTSTGRPA